MTEEQLFVQQLNKHQNIVHKVCRLYVDTPDDREDLFQEITLQAWKAYQNFRGDAKFSTWLYRVALNTAITYFKKDQKQAIFTSADQLPEVIEYNNPIEEQVKAMYTAIGSLNKIDKALVMLYLEDYSYIEIGDMLGITANNVAVKMNRIKLKLKEKTNKIYHQ